MSRAPHTCVVCGAVFLGTVRAVYCSQPCKARAYYQRHRDRLRAYDRQRQRARWRPYARPQHSPRACAVCGQPFTPKNINSRYCSKSCRERAYSQRPPRPRIVTRLWTPP